MNALAISHVAVVAMAWLCVLGCWVAGDAVEYAPTGHVADLGESPIAE